MGRKPAAKQAPPVSIRLGRLAAWVQSQRDPDESVGACVLRLVDELRLIDDLPEVRRSRDIMRRARAVLAGRSE